MEINNLIEKYRATKDEVVFNEIYCMVSGNWRYEFITLGNKYKIDEHDVWSIAHIKLLEVIDCFDETKGTKFTSLLRTAIKRGCIDEVRRIKDYYQNETPLAEYEKYSEENESCALDFIESAHANAEDEIIEHIQKNHDQRQLIVALTETADEMTRQSLSAFAKLNSYNAAAKLLGITDKTVKKNIRKLSRNYDGNRFGDYYDFFTVATRVI